MGILNRQLDIQIWSSGQEMKTEGDGLGVEVHAYNSKYPRYPLLKNKMSMVLHACDLRGWRKENPSPRPPPGQKTNKQKTMRPI
jgi:hypothetical protein